MSNSEEILGAVLALEDEERFLLVEELLERFSPGSQDWTDDELAVELERRKADFEHGKKEAIPWSVLRDEAGGR